MEVVGYLLLLAAGLSLGLIGGGGAILTVPILVYLFRIPPVQATGFSLGVVGLAALSSCVGHLRQGLVSVRVGGWFALPSVLGVFLVRNYVVPALPETLSFGFASVARDRFILVLFALVMLAAALSMLRRGDPEVAPQPSTLTDDLKIAGVGFLVGGLASFLGAGGGFMIVPALVAFARLPMKTAIGTSLGVIAVQSLVGFGVDLARHPNPPWVFLAAVSTIVLVGSFVGVRLGRRVPGSTLKPAFGWFVLVLGTLIVAKEALGG
ncbi:MAG: sulfite exporter TauE/SafE family protein [Fimbriimonadaceae bacterium]|nr:sulfite exporter TauE/SafE family protein [Fimbriimonadaceae bacterium]